MTTPDKPTANKSNNSVRAAMDLGSNSFRLLIGRQHHNKIEVLHKGLITVRLTGNLNKNGMISAKACSRARAALEEFQRQLKPYQPAAIKICGTQALRQAANNEDISILCQDILKTTLEIINGQQEAELTLLATIRGLTPIIRPFGVLDVGGGSTEYIATGPSPPISLALGAVNLTEKFFPGNQAGTDNVRACRHFLHKTLNQAFAHQSKIPMLIGSGGTATSLAALALKLQTYREEIVHGCRLHLKTISAIIAKLAAMDAEKRNNLPCLEDGRGRILLAGALVIQSFLQISGNKSITVSDHGLLEGIFLSMDKN